MSTLPFGKLAPSSEGIVLTPALRHALSGSVTGATDEAVQRAAVEANPSRLLIRMKCWKCSYAWQAPAKGNCPQCHCKIVEVLEALPCMAARI